MLQGLSGASIGKVRISPVLIKKVCLLVPCQYLFFRLGQHTHTCVGSRKTSEDDGQITLSSS